MKHFGWINFLIFFLVIPLALLTGNFVLNQKANQTLDKLNKTIDAQAAVIRQEQKYAKDSRDDLIQVQNHLECILTALDLKVPNPKEQCKKSALSGENNTSTAPIELSPPSSEQFYKTHNQDGSSKSAPPKKSSEPSKPAEEKPKPPSSVLPFIGTCITNIVINNGCI